jgi:ABC-2 type transport system permease protein|tara:strand:- start:16563 stop:17294 length:732 start_codon:yes stop_codon:yes gene_type:complete
MLAIAKKEFNAFFQSSTGVLIICTYLGLNGIFLWLLDVPFNLIESGYAQLDGLFMLSPWVFMFLIPAIGMKMISEEKRSGTIEWLFTKPVTEWQIILGKWIAGMLLVVFALIPTFIYAITLYNLGNPIGNLDFGSLAGSYIGLLLLASGYLAISLFASSITENSIVSFVTGVLFCLFFYIGFEQIANLNALKFSALFWMKLGMNEHYTSISRGVLDFRDVVYFIALSYAFLSASKTILKSRNW